VRGTSKGQPKLWGMPRLRPSIQTPLAQRYTATHGAFVAETVAANDLGCSR